MPWQRRKFKGNKVFARIDGDGNLLTVAGRVEIRYKLSDPRAYKATPANLETLSAEEGGAQVWPDEEAAEGVEPAEQTGKAAGSKKPAGRSAKSAGAASHTGADPAGDDAAASAPAAKARASRAPPMKQVGALRIGGLDDGTSQPPYLEDRAPIVAYTDGACSGNPGPAGIGVVLLCDVRRRELSEFLGAGANNIAELTAIKRALELIKDPARTVLLHTDSQYSIGVLSGWKAKANHALIESIKQELRRFPDVRLIKVPGHAGVPENERCDVLAREAITRG